MSDRLDALIRALSDPAVYPHGPASVQVVQTHISAVFIAGELVYKIKKPVNFGFLDFTTLEKRQFFCNQEVTLNSRFSEGIYLGVVDIREGPGGVNLRGEGEVIDAAVLMRHIPEDRIMVRMLEADRITPEFLDRLADRISYFHAQAARGPHIAGFGSAQVIYQNLKENFDQTAPYVGLTVNGQTHETVSTLALDFLRTHQSLFAERVKRGFIRDCHGDLHLDHVVIMNGIMLFDCIEFNDRFRYGDTAADLAFLLMDLEFRGYPDFADRIARRYAQTSGDVDVLRLLGFYKSYRAFVRGKVLSLTCDETEVSEAEKKIAIETAHDYFVLSVAALKPPPRPVLIVVCGLMGTGKSFLAAQLGKRLGVQPLRSDEIRKRMYGLSPSEHRLDKYGEGIYTPDATRATYQALLEEASRRLGTGRSVILDATFSRVRDRMHAREKAGGVSARFRLIECTAPDEVIRGRLAQRATQENEPSDGRWEVFPKHKADFEPIRPAEREDHRVWKSTTDLNHFLTSFVRELMLS